MQKIMRNLKIVPTSIIRRILSHFCNSPTHSFRFFTKTLSQTIYSKPFCEKLFCPYILQYKIFIFYNDLILHYWNTVYVYKFASKFRALMYEIRIIFSIICKFLCCRPMTHYVKYIGVWLFIIQYLIMGLPAYNNL